MGQFFENSKKAKEMSAASSTSLSGENQVDGLPPAPVSNSKLPRATGTPAASAATVRATAEQEVPHSEILRHSTGIGCLLLSINPTLLKEMSGKFTVFTGVHCTEAIV